MLTAVVVFTKAAARPDPAFCKAQNHEIAQDSVSTQLLLGKSLRGAEPYILPHLGISKILILIGDRESNLPRTFCELDMTRDQYRETLKVKKSKIYTKEEFKKRNNISKN